MSGVLLGMLLLVGVAAPLAGQATIVFHARLVHVDGHPTANLRVRYPPHGSTVTDVNGQFSTALPAAVDEVTVELVDGDWTVLYPRGGRVAVPRGVNRVTEIIIGETVEAAALRVLAEQHEKLAVGLAAVGANQNEIRGFLQDFAREITARLAVDSAALGRQIDLQRERIAQFPSLSATIRGYIFEAKNLRDYFKHFGARAFRDREVYRGLEEPVGRYGEMLAKLDHERPGFEYLVRTAWQSEELQGDLRAFYDYAITEIHTLRFLQLNESLVVMNQVLSGEIRDQRRIQEAQAMIDNTVRELDLRLPELERRAERVLAFLSRS